jgi:hypothetical protein
MTLARALVPGLLLIGVFVCWPPAAFADCEQMQFLSLHTAEKSAFYNRDFPRLLALNVKEATYADACGHRESSAQRGTDLEEAALHYSDAAYVELGHQRFALAKKHYLRSNAIIAELLKSTAGPRREALHREKQFNDDGLRRAAARKNTAA